jgi:hypothetical protein
MCEILLVHWVQIIDRVLANKNMKSSIEERNVSPRTIDFCVSPIITDYFIIFAPIDISELNLDLLNLRKCQDCSLRTES